MSTVTLYGKPGCHLCDDAREMLERLRADHSFRLVERDITEDEVLHRAYLERIPVVDVDGAATLELLIDEQELRRVLDTL